MEKKQKYLMSIIIVLVVVIAGVAVGFHYLTPSQSTLKGNTIIIASSATPSSLDPAVAFDTNSVFFDDQMYQSLLGYGNTTYNGQTVGSLTPVPELATSWTVNANGSVLFNLRQGVTFWNGDQFNSSAVQFSLDRVIQMKQGGDFHVYEFLNESGIHVLGKYQVLLVPSAPYPWFLNLFQLWVTDIVDPSFVNAHGGITNGSVNTYMSDHAMGTGPYTLNQYGTTQITLTANPNYWGGAPNISNIVYEIVPSPATQQTLLEKGSVNLALNIPLNEMNTVKNYTNVKIKAGPTSSEYYIGLDQNVTPYFSNLDVRKAIEYAVNTTNLTQYSTFGYGIGIKSVIAPTIESYIPAFKNYTTNLTMAKHYMALAGYQKGFSTTFYYTSGDPIGGAIATILQGELAKINISLTLTPVESATFDFQVGAGTYPMFYDGWVNLLATPDDGMRPLFNAANLGPYGNFAYYDNKTVSNDLINASKELNITQRDALYHQVQNILASQAVEVPLFNLENVIPMTDNIHNLYIYPTFDIFIDQASMS